MTRREWLKTMTIGTVGVSAGARLGSGVAAVAPEDAAGPFELPPLPYPIDAIEPHLDAQTMQIHHDRHHAAYVNNLNAAIAKHPSLEALALDQLLPRLEALPEDVRLAIRNNGGGHANHSLFWPSLAKGGRALSGDLANAVDRTFGSATTLHEALVDAGLQIFGSGWAWLSLDRAGTLVVETTPNQDSPLMKGHRPLLGIDVWEHAYYLRYQNRRSDYLQAVLNVIAWDTVQERYAQARKA
jgi:Fe-Mn family superoxide dismutase